MTTSSTQCAKCGAQARESARFCDSCGALLDVDVALAEYKQVTVVFADVVRSMELANCLGPERLRELMSDLVNRSARVVRRYGGTLNQFTGDGIMALFGAPKMLEDHARRACLAALDLQAEIGTLAVEIASSEGFTLQLRIGLNSGEVIAGDIGSAPIAYTALGQHVGMAQRMESVAPPGGVMLSESTSRLVENDFALGTREFVRIKGSEEPVPARRLLSTVVERRLGRHESRLVGRQSETTNIALRLDQAAREGGAVITISGPPGVGKSRLVREALVTAKSRGFETFTTYCESHTREISFHVVARLFRAVFGIGSLTSAEARTRVHREIRDATAEDVLLLDDLLGIRDTNVPLPDTSPDARRHRLIELITAMSLARQGSTTYVLEDVHWIDDVSESMLTVFLAVVPRMHATVLITYRPEYRGALSQTPGAEAIALAPLSDSHTEELLKELLGEDSSVRELSRVVADRAAGIPFCAEEIVRDLAERGEIQGNPGSYVCNRELRDVHVPPTLQAAIGARIDRLTTSAKRTLNAAAVIGARFRADVLARLLDNPDLPPLIEAELVDQVEFGEHAVYAFHHPLTQKVAYESQLKAVRSELHRRAAAIMQQGDGASTGEGAAIMATHYEAAGDLTDAYDWYMRAADLYGARDIRAARGSWHLARRVADQLPQDDPNRLAMRIAPRAVLCGSAFEVGGTPAGTGFEELRELTAEAGDKASLAIGMAGHIATLAFNSRYREAAAMASEFATLVESLGDPEMIVGLLWTPAQAKWEVGEATESLRLAERIIDLARGDPTMGNVVMASPLALATMVKGVSKMFLGRRGWRRDIDEGIALAQSFDPATRAWTQLYKYVATALNGAFLPDADDVRLAKQSLEISERAGDKTGMAYSLMNLAVALIYSPAGDRAAGVAVLARAREMLVREQLTTTLRRNTDIEVSRERARSDDLDGAIELARTVLEEQFNTGEMVMRGPATTALVEALLRRGTEEDLAAAQQAIERLDAVPTEPGFVLHELPILRLRALLARAHGDEDGYRTFLARFRAKAEEAEFEGCLAQANAMASASRDG